MEVGCRRSPREWPHHPHKRGRGRDERRAGKLRCRTVSTEDSANPAGSFEAG